MSIDLGGTFKFDYDVCVNVRSLRDGKDIEDPVYSHRLLLATASPFLKSLLLAAPLAPITSIDIDLRLVPNGLEAFKVALSCLYTGELKPKDGVQASQVLCVARILQIPSVESKIFTAPPPPPAPQESNPLMYLIQQPLLGGQLPLQNYFQTMLAALYLQQAAAEATPLLTPPSSTEDTVSRPSADSSPRTTPPPSGEKVLPMDDKDGWCRNKKYIEKVDAGFQCTVCRKVYGRYNSVSYHVTIYHRNPPIRCDEPGCTFSTREARYIHFHKYYRHHIPLPESIDLGSRKCQYCRHVSKSPAMLQKHMARHLSRSLDQDLSLTFLDPESKPDLTSTVVQRSTLLDSPGKAEISV